MSAITPTPPDLGTAVPEDYWERRARMAERELVDARQVIAILLARLGGEVTVTDQEIVEVGRIPTIESFRDDASEGVTIRVR
jgi:hypothetical protein